MVAALYVFDERNQKVLFRHKILTRDEGQQRVHGHRWNKEVVWAKILEALLFAFDRRD